MKIAISTDEMYPLFAVEDGNDPYYLEEEVYKVPKKTVKRWRRVADEFDAVQTEMRELVGWDD